MATRMPSFRVVKVRLCRTAQERGLAAERGLDQTDVEGEGVEEIRIVGGGAWH